MHFCRNLWQSGHGFDPRISLCLLIRTTVKTHPCSCERSPKLFTTARSACIVLSDQPQPLDLLPILFLEEASSLFLL